MLPRWRDEWRILISPRQVAVWQLARGWRSGTPRKQVFSCDQDDAGLDWEPPLQRLLGQARQNSKQVEVILSNHYVHYAVIPWKDQLADAQEREAYLRHYFGMAYGEAAQTWDLRVSRVRIDQPSLASGVEHALVQRLRILFEDAGVRLSAIRPHLVEVLNQSRAIIGRRDAWLMLQEGGRLHVALHRQGAWRSIRSHYVDDWAVDQKALLAREAVLCGIDPGALPVLMCGPECLDLTLPSSAMRLSPDAFLQEGRMAA